MIRRMQLLESERRFSARRVRALGDRIREGLLRDNKVVPAVLGIVALLIFAWLIAGLLTGDPGGEQQQASKQASLAQVPAEEAPAAGSPETPAPDVENRDADSYSAFKAKDPFRDLIPKAGESTNAPATTSKAGSSSKTDSSSKTGSNKAGSSKSSSRSDGEDFIDQSFPRDSGGTGGGNGGAGGGSRGTGNNNPGGGPGGGGVQGGNGGLFNSGGDLALPPHP